MKIQENYFYKLDDLKEIKIIWKKYDKANVLEIGIDYPTAIVDLYRLSGIKLTEEWLLKFGFELNGCNFELPNFRFHVNKPINYNGFIFCDGCSVITEKIQYVHQLQNLHFCLTGTELTVA